MTVKPIEEIKRKSNHRKVLFISLLVVIILWATLGCISYILPFKDWSERGQFGDMFGATNALFSALALAALIYTLYLQHKSLELQISELILQRKELRINQKALIDGAEAQAESATALQKQINLLAQSAKFSAWNKCQEIWTAEEFYNNRRKLFSRLDNSENSDWGSDERKDALEACARMDEFTHLAEYLDREKMLDIWDDPLGKAWFILKEIVFEERKHTKWATKWKGFETIGSEALEKLKNENRAPKWKFKKN